MNLATLTAQNQLTLPAAVRKTLKLQPGDKLWFEADEKTGELKARKLVKIEASQGRLKHYKQVKPYDSHGVWLERFSRKP